MKQIKAKFKSKCAETGKVINKGETMLYNYTTRQCYAIHSNTGQAERSNTNDAELIEAQENAYFDNFTYLNY